MYLLLRNPARKNEFRFYGFLHSYFPRRFMTLHYYFRQIQNGGISHMYYIINCLIMISAFLECEETLIVMMCQFKTLSSSVAQKLMFSQRRRLSIKKVVAYTLSHNSYIELN